MWTHGVCMGAHGHLRHMVVPNDPSWPPCPPPLHPPPQELKTTRVRAARATQRLQEVASESGPLSELLTLRVPLPLDPRIMLTGGCTVSVVLTSYARAEHHDRTCTALYGFLHRHNPINIPLP